MAKEQFEEARKSRFFKPWDIAAYILIIIIIVVAFIPLMINKGDGEISGLSVTYGGKEAARYSFDGGFTDFNAEGIAFTLTEEEKAVYIDIRAKDGYNIIKIDTENKVITMEEADCSKKADCTKMRIASSADSIICLPHSLVILPTVSGKLPNDIII